MKNADRVFKKCLHLFMCLCIYGMLMQLPVKASKGHWILWS